MASLKAWLINPHEQSSAPYIQLKFPMIDLKKHEVTPLFMHPTELEHDDLKLIEKRFSSYESQGNLVYARDFPNSDFFWN